MAHIVFVAVVIACRVAAAAAARLAAAAVVAFAFYRHTTTFVGRPVRLVSKCADTRASKIVFKLATSCRSRDFERVKSALLCTCFLRTVKE